MTLTTSDVVSDIAVIDITNPFEPAYCFLARQPSSSTVVLTAEEYVRSRHPQTAPQSQRPPSVQLVFALPFEPLSTMDGERLAGLFPSLDLVTAQANGENLKFDDVSVEDEQDLSSEDITPLGTLAFKSAFAGAAETGSLDDADILLRHMPKDGGLNEITSFLRTRSVPNSCIPLIIKAFEHRSNPLELDLSGLMLTSTQLATVANANTFHGIEILDLSHYAEIDYSALARILRETRPSLNTLVLFNTPGLSADDVRKAEDTFDLLEVILHSQTLEVDALAGPVPLPTAKGRRCTSHSTPYMGSTVESLAGCD